MRRIHPLLALPLLVLSLTASAGIAVAPGIIDQQLAAGDNVLEFVVSNTSDKPMEIDFSTGPLSLTLEGSATAAKSDPLYDASPLIRFEKQSFVLQPRRWRRVRATLNAPARGGGLHGVIYVRGTEANLPADAKVKVNLRLGVLLTLSLPGEAQPSLRLDEINTSSAGASVRVRNTGNIHLRPEGRLVLRSTAGDEVWSGKLITGAVLPGHERELRIEPLPQLPSGQYSAEVEITSPVPARLARKLALVDGVMLVSREPKPSR